MIVKNIKVNTEIKVIEGPPAKKNNKDLKGGAYKEKSNIALDGNEIWLLEQSRINISKSINRKINDGRINVYNVNIRGAMSKIDSM